MICPICKRNTKNVFDIHHVQSRSHGGSNLRSNKIRICPNCHRQIHLGDIIIEGKVLTTAGVEVIFHKKGEPSITNKQPPAVYIISR